VKHRAADLGRSFDAGGYPGRGFEAVGYAGVVDGRFDTAGYGGGFDLEADHRFPGGFEPIATPAGERRRRGHPVALAGTAGIAVLGVALLIAGATQLVQRNEVGGYALPQPGRNPVAAHQAGPGPLHAAPSPASTSAPPSAVSSPFSSPFSSPLSSPSSPSPAAPTAQQQANTGAAAAVRPAQGNQLPNTIRLPRGGSAYLVHVQVNGDGSLPVPSGVDQAVWWGTGLNAASGATVFAGHVNWAGVTGPFAELWDDGIGNVVTIRDNSGAAWRYRVTQVLTLNKTQLPQQAPALFSASGPPRIVLATCGGEWVQSKHSYADNRVLVAVPVR
jgi:hypothetical protein